MDPRLDPTAPEAAPWYLALALDERGRGAASDDTAARTNGKERFALWREELGLTEALVERRIATSGLTQDELYAVLGEDATGLQARMVAAGAVPGWLAPLLRDLARPTSVDLPGWTGGPPNAALLDVVEPLLSAGLDRLQERLDGRASAARVAPADLLLPIRQRLLDLLERPMILELHAAGLLGQLPEGTPTGRFDAFVRTLSDPDQRVTLLRTYPVMARLAWEWIEQWTRTVDELFEALDADAPRLAATFGELGAPTSLLAVDSDPHRFGRHVWFVDFEQGTRLVFKPRPCAAEASFQEHVAALGAGGMQPSLRTLRVVDAREHGWMEFVEAHPSSGPDGLAEFHRRQGAWLAVLWTLACTDVHYENIIAAGDDPVPIDHETILRNRVFTAAAHDADLRAMELIGDSIHGVDLLPAPRWDAGFGGTIDQSGMGTGYDEAGTIAIEQVLDAGTATMRVGVAPITPERQANRAQLVEAAIDPRDWVDAIEEGFTSAWSHLASDEAAVHASLDRFEGATVRMVLRPTQNYLHLLEVTGHPEYLQDALERERALFQLWMYPEDQGWRLPTVESERRQLLVGDVPWFGARTGRMDVVTGDGHVLTGAVDRRGIDVARGRVALLADPAELERQLWVLRSSLARWGTGTPVRSRGVTGGPLAVADEVARRLLAELGAGRGRSQLDRDAGGRWR